MSKEELTGLFSGSQNTDAVDNSNSFSTGSRDDNFPEGFDPGLRGLGEQEYNAEESDRLDPSIRSKIVYSEFHGNLDSGLGREKVVEYVDDNSNGYDVEDTLELKLYLLDRLDSNKGHDEGKLLGENIFQEVREFDESGGKPQYLEDYSTSQF